MIDDYFRIAFGNLRKRGMRSWLTVLGIFIGIMAVVAIISLGQGFQKAVQDQFTSIGGDKLFVMPKGQFGPPGSLSGGILTTKDVDKIKKVNGIEEVAYMTGGNAKIVAKDKIRFYVVYGMPVKETATLFAELFPIESGRYMKNGERGKVVLGSYWGKGNILGEPVSIRDKVEINGKIFTVIGIFKPRGTPDDDSVIAITDEDFKELFNSGDRVDQIIAKVSSGQDVRAVGVKVEDALRKSRGEKKGKETFYLLTPEQILKSFQSVFLIVQVFIIGVAAISLIVGGIGIMNTMYTSVVERTKDIGIMKAIGARNSDVLLLFLIESGLLGLVGGAIGIILGMGIAKGVEYVVTAAFSTTLLQAYFPWYLIVGAGLFSFFAGIASGVFPAMQASRLNPVQALRYE